MEYRLGLVHLYRTIIFSFSLAKFLPKDGNTSIFSFFFFFDRFYCVGHWQYAFRSDSSRSTNFTVHIYKNSPFTGTTQPGGMRRETGLRNPTSGPPPPEVPQNNRCGERSTFAVHAQSLARTAYFAHGRGSGVVTRCHFHHGLGDEPVAWFGGKTQCSVTKEVIKRIVGNPDGCLGSQLVRQSASTFQLLSKTHKTRLYISEEKFDPSQCKSHVFTFRHCGSMSRRPWHWPRFASCWPRITRWSASAACATWAVPPWESTRSSGPNFASRTWTSSWSGSPMNGWSSATRNGLCTYFSRGGSLSEGRETDGK